RHYRLQEGPKLLHAVGLWLSSLDCDVTPLNLRAPDRSPPGYALKSIWKVGQAFISPLKIATRFEGLRSIALRPDLEVDVDFRVIAVARELVGADRALERLLARVLKV